MIDKISVRSLERKEVCQVHRAGGVSRGSQGVILTSGFGYSDPLPVYIYI
jgi:hypothetical protein